MDSMHIARVMVDALKNTGVRDIVIGPGSRNAPLVYALAESASDEQLRLHVRIDERSAAFTALGMAMGTNKPAAVITTSGTAAGNLLPAVMEAAHADIPLVAITADRPEEIHGTGANQTTNQRGLYSHHARTSINITDTSAITVRSSVTGALAVAQGTDNTPAGPVHLNVQFAEPLVPSPEEVRPSPEAATGVMKALSPLEHPEHLWDARWDESGSSLIDDPAFSMVDLKDRHTVVVAGHGAGSQAVEFAIAQGLPLFAEPSSNARYSHNAVAAYPVLLEQGHPLVKHISRVVLFGRPTLSRQIQALLKRENIQVALYQPKPVGWCEPAKAPGSIITDISELAEFAGRGPTGWLAGWHAASSKAQLALENTLMKHQDASGMIGAMRTASLVASMVQGHFMLGSSSVIRDVDITMAPPSSPRSTVFAHRGLAGIDGTISSAAGIALATGIRTTVLCGDLSFLYDSNGLLIGELEEQPQLDIFVLNDRGGAIFAGLEHGKVAEYPGMAGVVERFFGVPHNVEIAQLCAGMGVQHTYVRHEYELIAALGDPAPGIRVFEIASERTMRPVIREAIKQAVRRSFC